MVICATEKKFREFVGYEVPEIENIKYVDSREDKSISYNAQIDLARRVLSVNIELLLNQKNKNVIASILYHELTHLYDYDLYIRMSVKENEAFL